MNACPATPTPRCKGCWRASVRISSSGALASRFDIDLFCGWFMAGGNEGVELSPATLLALGERGIRLGIDLYAPDDA